MRPLLSTGRLNAVLAWISVALLLGAGLTSLATGDPLWAGFVAVVCCVALAPTVVARNPQVMVPWEVLAVAVVPAVAHSGGVVLAVPATVVDVTTYASLAALALVVTAELHMFTPVRMNARFAAAFVVLTTMAIAGAWAVVQYTSDRFLGTAFIDGLEPLMWDLTLATLVGCVAGPLFETYYRWIGPVLGERE